MLERWRERDVFHESIRRREGAEPFIFYEGPPTANGRPGSHHVLSRVFKDVFPRYKTMQGHYVPRKAGWDCHGLPVELEVEKELGFHNKHDIERFGSRRVQRPLPRVRAALHRRVERADRADRLLDRHRRRLLHARERVRRVRLVVAQAGLGEGAAGRGQPGRPLLHPLRHRPLVARAGARLQGRGRPVGVREVPARGRARRLAARLDDDALDAGPARGDRRGPGGHLRARPPRGRQADPGGGPRGARARRGGGDRGAHARLGSARACATSRPSPTSPTTASAATRCSPATSCRSRTAPAWSTPARRSARTTSGSPPRTA